MGRAPVLAVSALILASAAYLIEIAAFPVFVTAVAADLGRKYSDLTYLATAYNLPLMICIVIGGLAGDRWSQRGVVLTGLGLFLLGGGLFWAAKSTEALTLARMVQGAGAGLFAPAIPAMLADAAAGRMVRLLSIWGVVSGIVGALSPALVGLADEVIGLRASWAVVLGPALLSFTLLAATRNGGATPHPALRPGWPHLGTPVWVILGYVFVNYGATAYVLFSLPQALALRGSEAGTGTVGVMVTLAWIAFTLGGVLVGRLPEVRWLLRFVTAGAALNAVAVLALSASGVPVAMVAALAGLGMAFNNVPTTALAFALGRAEDRGLISAADILAARAGGALTVLAVGATASVWPLALATALAASALMCRWMVDGPARAASLTR